MEISSDRVVTIHYTLKNDSGTVLDSSAGGEPLAYIQGHGNLVSGLEKALEGKEHGSSLAVVVAPAEGYGERDEALIQRVPKRTLQGSGDIKKGMQFQARTDDGMRLFTVTAVIGDMVTLDAAFRYRSRRRPRGDRGRTGAWPRARRRRPSPLAPCRCAGAGLQPLGRYLNSDRPSVIV